MPIKEVLYLSQSKTKPTILAILSGIVMGSGQLLNRQFLKGFIYLAAQLFLFFVGFPYILWGLEGLITLGWEPKRDHSLFLMVYGILSIIALLFILYLYVSCIKDAYRCAIKRQNHEEMPSLKQSFKDFLRRKSHLLFVAPGLFAVVFIVVLPLVFSIMIGFTSYDTYNQPPAKLLQWVGLDNFKDILSLRSWSYTLRGTLLWTVLFTALTSVLPYAVGILTAVVLTSRHVRAKKLFKGILVLPWAIPSYISIFVWRGMFNTNDGIINSFLNKLGITSIEWLNNVFAARASIVLVSIWAGFTFPMLIAESIMKSISPDLYEAARLDGASPARSFRSITLPLLIYSISPLFIMGIAGAFNNFNIIFLLTEGQPVNMNYMYAGDTDILISWIYNMTFAARKFNYASAISLILFIFLAAFSIINLRRSKTYSEEGMLQ